MTRPSLDASATKLNNRVAVAMQVTILPDDEDPIDEDPEDDPNTETVAADINFSIDLGAAQSEFVFDALGSAGTDLTYEWDFGDGNTSEEGFNYHVYEDPGKYTVKLTVTNSVGRTNTFEEIVYVLPTIEDFIPSLSEHRSIQYNPNQNNGEVEFDLGELFEGFRYEVDLGDGSNTIVRRNGDDSKVRHDYGLGTYTYTVRVYDERTEDGLARAVIYLLAVQEEDETLILEESTWFTLWSDAPKAMFSMSNPNDLIEASDSDRDNSDENGDFFGNIPLTINFDASQTETPENNRNARLTYTWDFGDGSEIQETEEREISHVFTEMGFYLVTLTATDTDTGLSDTSQAFVKAKSQYDDTLIGVNYPITSLSNQGLRADFSFEAAFARDELSVQEVPLEENKYVDHYPYVLVKNLSNSEGENPYKLFVQQFHHNLFCGLGLSNMYSPAPVFNNGLRNIPIGTKNFLSLPEEAGSINCTSWKSNYRENIVGSLLRPTNNILGITTNYPVNINRNQDFRNEIDAIAELRVPRVYLAILPDSMIEGNLPSPNLIEKRAINQSTGKEELMLTVQIRESDVDELRNRVTFDVPAYGVDNEGRMVNANGYFHADIVGEDSDCGDCIMVDGRTTISLTVPLPTLDRTEATFDLSTIRVSRDGTCTTDTISDLNMYLNYCINVTTSSELPLDAPQDIIDFEYPVTLTDTAINSSNRVAIFSNLPNPIDFVRGTVENTWKWFNDLSFQDVAIFTYNLLPFVSDGIDLLNQLRITYLTDQEADIVITTFAAAGLVLDATTGGLLDVTAFFKAAYKVSLRIAKRQGGGALAKIFRDEITFLLGGAISPADLMTSMKNTFGQVFTVGKACGLSGAVRCFGQMDISITDLADLDNIDFRLAAEQFDDGLNAAKRNNIGAGCFLELSASLTHIYDPINTLVWFFGIDPDNLTGGNTLSLLQSSSKGCNDYRQNRTTYRNNAIKDWNNQRIDQPNGSPIPSKDQKAIKKEFEDSRLFEFHHIVPVSDSRNSFCGRIPGKTISYCGGSRKILLDFNINIVTDPNNLVPLRKTPKPGSPKATVFDQYFNNNTMLHDRKSDSGGPHSRSTNEEIYDKLKAIQDKFNNDKANAANAADISKLQARYRTKILVELRAVGFLMLTGKF